MEKIKEFHLFAGIGGGIYGGHILGHTCCGGVEIDNYCQRVLRQRQFDGWMNEFPIYSDIKDISGTAFKASFDVLCGGFPCQAFSHAAHGKNIKEKNLWQDMLRFVRESEAPIVFAENVTEKAIEIAKMNLEELGYDVERCRLACKDLNGDHRRHRFWLLAVKDYAVFNKVSKHVFSLPKFTDGFWQDNPLEMTYPAKEIVWNNQKRGIGNAQIPLAAATAFRVLANRHLTHKYNSIIPHKEEILMVYEPSETWIKRQYPNDIVLLHTPTTMANYCHKSMMKHPSCVKYAKIFNKPTALYDEYLMGFPIGASSPLPLDIKSYNLWNSQIYENN